MQYEILDPVWSKISKQDIPLIEKCLLYEKDRWVLGDGGRREKKIEPACFIDRRNGRFLTGFLPRIKLYCQTNNIPLEGIDVEIYEREQEPSLPGIILRPDQLRILKQVSEHQRGIIKSPTGSGKTVLAGAIRSMWPSARMVFLCHTIDLLTQTYKVFVNDFKFKDVFILGGGAKKESFNWPDYPSTLICTCQTYEKMDLKNHFDWADIVIIDEAHHINAGGRYSRILERSLALIRIGVTATPPKTGTKEADILEGYLGPIIGEFTLQEGIETGVLAKPIINLIPVPYSEEIGDVWNYRDTKDENENLVKGVYRLGIVENRARNRLILTEAHKYVKKGESVLIMVATNTDHGKILSEMAHDLFDMDVPFVYGEMPKDERVRIKDALENKEILCVIANVVFHEGINIPSLNTIINSSGQGSKEKTTLQIIGRGLRTTETKKVVKIIDFLDPYRRYLAHHCISRLITYAEQGWMKGESG